MGSGRTGDDVQLLWIHGYQSGCMGIRMYMGIAGDLGDENALDSRYVKWSACAFTTIHWQVATNQQ